MLNIKLLSLVTFSTLMLVSLVGCGGDGSCCDGPAVSLSKNLVDQNANSTVDIGVNGDVDALVPTVLVPLNTSLPPLATILVNGCDKKTVTQGCQAFHFDVQSNDPDGNNDNLTFAWLIDDILVSDKKSFCHKLQGVGSHSVKVLVTDEDNATGSDALEVVVSW